LSISGGELGAEEGSGLVEFGTNPSGFLNKGMRYDLGEVGLGLMVRWGVFRRLL